MNGGLSKHQLKYLKYEHWAKMDGDEEMQIYWRDRYDCCDDDSDETKDYLTKKADFVRMYRKMKNQASQLGNLEDNMENLHRAHQDVGDKVYINTKVIAHLQTENIILKTILDANLKAMKSRDKMISTVQKELEETKDSVKRISAAQKELEETKKNEEALKDKMKRIHPFSFTYLLTFFFELCSKMWTRSYDDDTVNFKEVNGQSSCPLTPARPTPVTRGQTANNFGKLQSWDQLSKSVNKKQTDKHGSWTPTGAMPLEGQPLPLHMKESIALLLSTLLGMQKGNFKDKIGNNHF